MKLKREGIGLATALLVLAGGAMMFAARAAAPHAPSHASQGEWAHLPPIPGGPLLSQVGGPGRPERAYECRMDADTFVLAGRDGADVARLRLASAEVGGTSLPLQPGKVTTTPATIDVDRGAVVEKYLLAPHAAEQLFVIARKPDVPSPSARRSKRRSPGT
jgi:hypothetical protein